MKNRVRVAVTVAFTAILLLAAAASPPSTIMGPLAVAAGDECILGCYDNLEDGVCSTSKHKAPQEGDFALYEGGWHDYCEVGYCNCDVMSGPYGYVDAKHPDCNPESVCGWGGLAAGGENMTLDRALALNDAGAIAAGLERFGDAVRLVPERGAVQLIGCTQQIVAHIPVPTETLELLRSHSYAD